MKLEQSFVVEAPVGAVWSALIDVQRVAPCLPGAEITDAQADGSYAGAFQVKLGPTTASYRGTLKIERLDEAAHVATMAANGQDKRGQGGAKAAIVSTLHEEDAGTRVEVVTDYAITGRLARFGRGGMIQDVANRLLRDFAACLQEELAASPVPPPAEPVPPPAEAAPSAGAPDVAAGPAPSPSPPPPPAPRATPRPSAPPVRGFRLLLSVLAERVRRAIARRRS